MFIAAEKISVKEVKASHVEELSAGLNATNIFSRILINRGMTNVTQAREFLNSAITHVHDPFLFADMERAAVRVATAIERGEKICVYGDYDVDGAIASALFKIFFKEIGVPLLAYIPSRLTEGYSLNEQAVNFLKGQGVGLIVTVDNGIQAHREIEQAQNLGMDVIVTDHHEVGETLPVACAVVNPQRKDCAYPFKGICGAGVAFKLLLGLRAVLRDKGFFKNKPLPNLKRHLDLLAIATVCDVVPLVGENRYFVKEGLSQLKNTAKVGLQKLLAVSGLSGEVSASDLGFRIGPRINACGRLKEASLGLSLLLEEDGVAALAKANELSALNEERRQIEADIVQEAIKNVEETVDLANSSALVVSDPRWHLGVVGIVAARLAERFKRPAFVLTQVEEGVLKGSGRSVPGISLILALRQTSNCLLGFGGHEAAAGLSLRACELDKFRRCFAEAVKAQRPQVPGQGKIEVDADLTTETISPRFLQELKSLEPHGRGNASPLFVLRGLGITEKRIVGENHLKLKLKHENQAFDAIAFKKSQLYPELTTPCSAILGLETNIYRGVEGWQMVIKEFVK